MVVKHEYSDPPELDIAVSHALLDSVARSETPATFRIHVPADVLAFGRADTKEPGYANAVRAAQAHGFAPVERLAGGRAAVFHDATLAFSMATPESDSTAGIHDRFRMISSAMAEAFGELGLDAAVGEVPGEYCPGEYSVNLAGRFKVMGVGQRLVKGAAHVGGVIVVHNGERIRDVLIPVYRALGLDWDPRTAGALSDRAPGIEVGDVRDVVIASLAKRFDISYGEVAPAVETAARGLTSAHLPKVA